MLFPGPDVAQRIMDERVRDCLHKAEKHRMLQEAGIDQRSWLSRQICWSLACLGRVLVSLGRRLQRLEETAVAAPRHRSRSSEASPAM